MIPLQLSLDVSPSFPADNFAYHAIANAKHQRLIDLFYAFEGVSTYLSYIFICQL
jgi:hypothetical protein